MKPWRLTDAAEDDLFDIWTYIAADPAAEPLEVIRILHGARDAALELGR